MNYNLRPEWVFVCCFVLSSLGGLSQVLREKELPSVQYGIGLVLYTGLAGLGLSLFWYSWLIKVADVWQVIGLSTILGVGGTHVIQTMIQAIANKSKPDAN